MEILANLVEKPQLYLKEVDLEDNHMNSQMAALIMQRLLTHDCIEILNFSKNKLDDQINKSLYNLLVSGRFLRELYLHWNFIT